MARREHRTRIDWLLAHGADPDVREGARATTRCSRCSRRAPSRPAALQALLRRAVSPAGAGGLARFLGACVASDHAGRALELLALDLLERGADPFAPSPAGDPPLALAVRLGWLRVVERLVAHGVDLDARDSHGMTALHLAAALGREAALKALIAQGADPDMRAADGQTPLGVALSSGRRDLADWLDWRGWPLPGRPLQAADLPSAAIVGEADAVRRLLDLGLPVDATDAQGCTALLRAAGGGHRAVVDLLLARGADPRVAARSGATPLSAAVSMRQVEIVERLLAAGAPLEQRLPGDVTVLMLAAALGLPDLVRAPADRRRRRPRQRRAGPRAAALRGAVRIHRARASAPGRAARHACCSPAPKPTSPPPAASRRCCCCSARAPNPAPPATRTSCSPASNACSTKTSRSMRGIRAASARCTWPRCMACCASCSACCAPAPIPDLRDALNRSAREIAVMRGFVDVAAEFVPATPGGVSMARFLREPR